MSRYRQQPLVFDGLQTVPIAARGGRISVEDFALPYEKGGGVTKLIESLPTILAGGVIEAIKRARREERAIIWGLGGHVIKCGLADVLLDLMRRGWITAVAMNGAASIHDFEIAISGSTSEDVEAALPDGRFGSAEETGREMNLAITEGVRDGLGMGEALGRHLERITQSQGAQEFAAHSLLLGAYRASIPVTVHVAVGTDTPHTHPTANGAAIGEATHRDFRLLCSIMLDLDSGGVYINAGSAVVLPEVFLKAISVVRNLAPAGGYSLAGFTTVNLDFLQHYRPRVNVVERPHARSGGYGYAITGHHEIMIPLLAAALIEVG
jgi:hypothetical protein